MSRGDALYQSYKNYPVTQLKLKLDITQIVIWLEKAQILATI